MRVLLLSVLLCFFAGQTGFSEARGKGAYAVGMYGDLFSGVKKADLMASMEIWAESVLDEFGQRLNVDILLMDHRQQFKDALDAGTLDFVVIPSAEYFALESYLGMEQLLFYEQYGGILSEYVLIAKKSPGEGKRLRSFRGGSVYCVEDSWRAMGRRWLEVQLADAKLGGMDDFFGEVALGTKCSRGVLGVFFGKHDACLVTKGGFEMMVELNPQIGVQLDVLEVSPGFIEAVLAPVRTNSVLFNAIDRMEEHPQGKQVLMLFGLDRIQPGTVKDVDVTRRWITVHQGLGEQMSSEQLSELGDQK